MPFAVRKRGGRKLVLTPEGTDLGIAPRHRRQRYSQSAARAFRWRKLLETGAYGTIDELATGERINSSYVSRVLRLTLLAPRIVESIVEGLQHPDLTLARIMRPFPAAWNEQATAMQLTAADHAVGRCLGEHELSLPDLGKEPS
jgi:hypothetical protein